MWCRVGLGKRHIPPYQQGSRHCSCPWGRKSPNLTGLGLVGADSGFVVWVSGFVVWGYLMRGFELSGVRGFQGRG